MAKVFYDDLVDLTKLEKKIKKVARTSEEKEELYSLVDEIVHHKVLGCVLDRLPEEHHEDFLMQLSERPHDAGLIEYLRERITDDFVAFIKEEVHKLVVEMLLFVEEKTRPENVSLSFEGRKKKKRKKTSKKNK